MRFSFFFKPVISAETQTGKLARRKAETGVALGDQLQTCLKRREANWH